MAQRSQINAKEKLGCEIDLVNASKDELIEHLCRIIEYEVEKGEDADYDLVRECSDWLDELTADLMVFTPEELEAKLEALKTGKDVPIFHPHKPHQTTSVPKIKRKVFARVAILVASLVLLSFLSLSVMAKYAGYDSVWTFISTNFMTILGMNSGETITGDGITIINNSGQKQYDTIEELLATEGFNVMYPSEVPDNQRITEIRFVPETEGHYALYFVFSDNSYTFQVYNYYIVNLETLFEHKCISVNGIEYYITSIDGTSYHAICQYNGFEYAIDSPNYDDLLNIINNMKG